jgi:signal transduction histidine kinase
VAHASIWAVPSLIAFTVLAGLNALAWRSGGRGPVWPSTAWVLGGALLFTLGDLATHWVGSPMAHWTAMVAVYTGLMIVAPAVFVLAARLTKRHGGPTVPPLLLRLAPAWTLVVVSLMLTSPVHELFVRMDAAADFPRGPLWYWYAASGYAWGMGALGLAVYTGVRARDAGERREARLIALAVALTLSGNFLEIIPFIEPPFDATSLGLAAGGLTAMATLRRGLPSLGPIPVTTLLETATGGVLLLDARGVVIGRNPALDDWLPDGPAVGEPAMPVLVRAFAQRERSDLPLTEKGLATALLSDDQPEGGHLFRLRDPDRWLRVSSTVVRWPVLVWIIRLRDETELQRLTEAAEDQASMLEAVNSATDEGVLVHVGDEIRFTNAQFHEIWGTPPELVSERSPGVLLRAYLPLVADQERFSGAVDRIRRDPLVRIRDEYRLNDGRTIERISLPLMQAGEPIGRVWRIRDVTSQRDSETALLQAQKFESLGLLSGGIAHDFNNLLMSVLGSADLARSELPADAPAQAYLADVQRAAERASELTRQLLAYAGKGRVENEPLHLSELTREVLQLIRVSVRKSVQLDRRLAVELPRVTGDASQLRQVVMNLLMNAADAVGDDEGTVTVTTEMRELSERDGPGFVGDEPVVPGPYVFVTVEDTGPGMSAEVRQRIFDPFFTTKFTGRGLGLAAALGIVRSHGGRIGVESEPGRGSRFVVALPAEGAPVAMADAQTEADAKDDRLEATVLVVDDEPHVARVAARMVEMAGGSAIVVPGGREALARYREGGAEIDAVLLDLTMPGLSGHDTLVALREVDAHVPVILTSGYPEEEVGGPLGSDPALAFIQKPYRAATLVDTLRRALGR